MGPNKCCYLICALFIVSAYAQDGADLTRVPEIRGSLAVETVVDRIERSAIFENDFGYVRRISWAETRDGLNRTFTFRPDYHGGLWQVDEVVFEETKNTVSYPLLIEKYEQIRVEFDIEWSTVEWVELRKPLHCGLAVWLYMFVINENIPLNIRDQADHWKRNYNRLQVDFTVEEFVIRVNQLEAMEADCRNDIDLYIVLDSSNSVGLESYQIAKNFIADFVSGFNIGENNARVGLIIFTTSVYLNFDLDDSFDKDVILRWIGDAVYFDGGTATERGILLMANTGFTEARGARSLTLGIPRIGIIFTDGRSATGTNAVIAAANMARDLSIELFALGIGNGINNVELLGIAGSQDRVFRVDSFTNINDARALITRGSCKSNVKANINTTYTGDLDNSESRSFEYLLPEDGLTIQVRVTMGSVTLYGSYTNPNPSPIWYDFLVQGIQQNRNLFIPNPTVGDGSRKKRQNVRTRVFYCTLIGGTQHDNMFAINALNGTTGCNCGCAG